MLSAILHIIFLLPMGSKSSIFLHKPLINLENITLPPSKQGAEEYPKWGIAGKDFTAESQSELLFSLGEKLLITAQRESGRPAP